MGKPLLEVSYSIRSLDYYEVGWANSSDYEVGWANHS